MFSQNNPNPNPHNDLLLATQPEDTVSGLAWHPSQNFLAASTWDGKVACWQIATTGQNELKGFQSHAAPALDVCWDLTGNRLFSAGCDNKAMMWDVASNQFVQVGAHDQPIKTIKYTQTSGGELLCTGGWDNTLKYWDTRQSTPIGTVQLAHPVYCASFVQNLAVVCTAQRLVYIYDLRANLAKEFRGMESPLKYQTRCVTCFPDASGFAIGSIEGRVAIQAADPNAPPANSFSFKCHRDSPAQPNTSPTTVHSINSISFHAQQGTFSTAGSDGNVVFWDKEERSRLASWPSPLPSPVTNTAFNGDGTLYAYSIGYDWHKGIEYNDPKKYPNALLVHQVKAEEVTKKPKGATRR